MLITTGTAESTHTDTGSSSEWNDPKNGMKMPMMNWKKIDLVKNAQFSFFIIIHLLGYTKVFDHEEKLDGTIFNCMKQFCKIKGA